MGTTDYQAPQSQGRGPSAQEEGGCYTKALALGSPWHLCNTNQLAFKCRGHVLANVLFTIAGLQFGHLERCPNCMRGLSGGLHGQILGLA